MKRELKRKHITFCPIVSANVGGREGPGKILWRRKWQPTPVSWPEKPPYRGAGRATVLGVTNSRTGLSD